MRLVFVVCLLPGCAVEPMFEVEVAWETTGRASGVFDRQVGARMSYFGAKHSHQTSEWHQGYAGELVLFVGSMTSTASICVNLERHEPIDNGQWGCSDCPDERFTTLTTRQCKDAVLEDEVPRVTFDFAIAP